MMTCALSGVMAEVCPSFSFCTISPISHSQHGLRAGGQPEANVRPKDTISCDRPELRQEDGCRTWASLSLTDVRAGLQQVRDRLDSFQHDGRTFWHAPGEAPGGPQDPQAHLLQILDETYRGYQDSRWVLDAMGAVPRGREATTGMALADAQLVAAVRRTVTRDRAHFELRPYRDLTAVEVTAIEHAAARFGEYAQLNAQIAMQRPR
jgi:winged helix DNA-binding protein